jgi:peptidoglycan/LPS O-acetylase OafA/YrhL
MLVGSWGIVGVDCFVMITAWFMLEATSFKSKQLLSVIVETVFYSLFLYSIMGWFTGTGITIKGLFKEFISFAYDEYWFVTAYLVLLLLAPLFNFVIRKMNNIQLKVAAGLLFLLMSVWKFLLWDSPVSTIGLFSALYFITAWMKRTKEMNFFNKKRNLVVIMLTCVTLILSICYSILPEGIRLSGVSKYLYVTLLAKNSPFMLGIAISLFYKFMSHNFSSKIINFLGKHSFSVYLIHENSYVYPTMWGGVLRY